MTSITVSYGGDLHCEAVHEASGSVLQTDAPKDNHGKGETFSPTDLLATAYATCALTIMGIASKRLDVEITGATARIDKIMSTDLPRRVVALPLTISVPATPSEADRNALEQAAYHCPVHHSLHPDIEKPITFHWGNTKS